MAVFKDVTLGFRGNEYTIPHNKVMRLIAIIEDIVSLRELTTGNGPKLSRLAEAYAEALKYAGAKVEIDEVYEALFIGEGAAEVSQIVTSLVLLMMPPKSYHPPEAEKAGKPTAAE